MSAAPLLDVRDLAVAVERPGAEPRPVLADVSFALEAGDTLGVVGESGSGKSTLVLALMGLLPTGLRASGSAMFEGRDLLSLPDRSLCAIRGARIGLVFQEPLTALNPAMTAGAQIAEGLRLHRGLARRAARAEALRILDRMRIPDAARRLDSYPHELSGGQRQRVGLAMALALEPALLLADEPTTALDATVQAEILTILDELVRERGMALILVSHDLGVIARACRRALVLYGGTRFEEGPTRDVLRDPLNPYTRALVAALPRPRFEPASRLAAIPGPVPVDVGAPTTCRFAPRCPDRITACGKGEPEWTPIDDARGLRCIHASARAIFARNGQPPPVPSS